MPVDVDLLPPEVARAAARARKALGELDTSAPDVSPCGGALSSFADWAMESGALTSEIQQVAATNPELAG
jgi:hypothetical protein